MSAPDLQTKLAILADAAKYDASCASSGARRSGTKGRLGNSSGIGICHSYTPDGRCISLLKLLLTNYCIYDCRFCVNRVSSDVRRARFTPEEVVSLTVSFYRRNYIEGLFLSSGIIRSPDYTMEQLVRVAKTLRREHAFDGYIHLKAVPGAAEELLAEAGRWADRLSANVELPTAGDLAELAPDKELPVIEQTMATIDERRREAKEARLERSRRATSANPASSTPAAPRRRPSAAIDDGADGEGAGGHGLAAGNRRYAPAGQSTQMVVGATASSDRDILGTASRLYRDHGLKRVYYSAFSPIPAADARLPPTAPPLLREHRLYQADWLLRFYGFEQHEVTPPEAPDLSLEHDPKTAWALRNREFFPVDVNRASRAALLRVPGLGVRSVERILRIRRWQKLRLDDLRRLGLPLARAQVFLETADHNPDALALDRLDLGRRLAPAGEQLELFAAASTPAVEIGAERSSAIVAPSVVVPPAVLPAIAEAAGSALSGEL